MIFSSLLFLFSFLPFILIGNYVWRNIKWQNTLLFIASLYFYAWGEREKVFVMLASILLNFFIGKWIENKEGRSKVVALIVGIVVNLGVLVYFKYSQFIVENINQLLSVLSIPIIDGIKYERLPLGISFYTFQSISYLVDVYRKEVKAQRNFLNLGLYVALFPQLVAGPIVRYNEIAEQLLQRTQNLIKFNEGIRRFVIGLGKKMLIANPMAYIADEIYMLPVNDISTPMAWLAVLAYSLQIYYDFSGYSDMAIGLGKMFGFDIAENFNFPYISKSIREFWTRWHISLSIWFRDYLYIPLGGSRGSTLLTMRNLIIVFFITGLWHGASWSFVIWGLFHGIFMLIERAGFDKILKRMPAIIQHMYMLLIVVFGWVLFRIENWTDALQIQKTMLGINVQSSVFSISSVMSSYYWLLLFVGVILCFPIFGRIDKIRNRRGYAMFESIAIFVILFLSIIEMANNTYNPFIYFRF
ncbi:MBOAT family protein [bacterium]|nr:MBOAT family protein [bacterium]